MTPAIRHRPRPELLEQLRALDAAPALENDDAQAAREDERRAVRRALEETAPMCISSYTIETIERLARALRQVDPASLPALLHAAGEARRAARALAWRVRDDVEAADEIEKLRAALPKELRAVPLSIED